LAKNMNFISCSGTIFKVGDYFRLDYPDRLIVCQIIQDNLDHWNIEMMFGTNYYWEDIAKYGSVHKRMTLLSEKEVKFYELFAY